MDVAAANASAAVSALPGLSNETLPFSVHIWPFGLAVFIGGLAGLFGNTMIILALISSKELKRNRCNIFVANLALADFVSCAYFVLYGVTATISLFDSDRYTSTMMTNETCFYVNIPAVISFNAGALTVLAIGVDRMTSLTRPLFYKTLPQSYAVVVNGLTWAFGLVNVILGWIYKDPTKLVPACVLPTALNGLAATFWNDSNIVINILVVTSYGLAYRKAKSMGRTESRATIEQITKNNRLLTSLIVFVCIYILGWMVTMLVIFLVTVLPVRPTVVFHCTMYVGMLASINVGCNFYIYYCRCDEYRKCFRSMLRCGKGGDPTHVVPFNHASGL